MEKTEAVQEVAPEPKARKEHKKEKKETAGLSPEELKELEDLKQKIIEEKAILKEQGMSGGQINKNEKIVAMVTRLNELKEKQDPGSSKKEKDAKKDSKKKTPLSAEEQKEYVQLQGDI
ncbi:DHX38, partial [Symbiodinium pilosum]